MDIEAAIKRPEGHVADLDLGLRASRDRVNERFDEVKTSLHSIEKSLEGVRDEIAQQDSETLRQLGLILGEIKSMAGGVRTRMDEFDERLRKLEQRAS